jgi:crotonobetainyl-CoA:carnitine CoA-transferase CaiB-like acyl-CoA transferase
MAESMAMWMMPRFMEYLDRGRPSKSDLMGRGPYGIFETSDGRYLTLGIVEDHFWTNLCRVLEFDDWLSDETLKGWTTRNRERRRILPRLQAAFKARPLDHWLTVLTRADVPVAPVCDFDDWTENPQFIDRAFFGASDAVDRPWPRFPLDFGHPFGAKGKETPAIGKDNEAVLGEIGLLAEEITRLRQERII